MPRPRQLSGMSLHELERMVNVRKKEISKLLRKRSSIQSRIDEIDRRIESLGGDPGAIRITGGNGKRPRNDQNLPDSIHAVLQKAGQPMKVSDIADAVQATGYRSSSANFRGIVNQALIKDKRFTSASRGMYQVKK